ncbi:MAG: NUDIX domain-containing protein [Candidatus Hodarchaeales archaeon]
MNNNWIEDKIYKRIQENLPIVSVDILTVHKGKLLLLCRNNEPAKGKWWTPGGRVRKGEQLADAAIRELEEETGLIPVNLSKKGVMSHLWPNVHFITVFFRAEVESNFVELNDEHSDFKWISSVSDELHRYLIHMIRESQIFKDV